MGNIKHTGLNKLSLKSLPYFNLKMLPPESLLFRYYLYILTLCILMICFRYNISLQTSRNVFGVGFFP